jgi:T5SS/PEP-CTERM-associated repeat protein
MTVDGVGSSLSVASTSISAHFRVGTVRPLGGGKLYITNGGRVTSNASIGFVGADAGGHGFVLVDGTGSTWTNSGDVQIGCGGVGVLNIDDGGLVTAASIAVSSYSGPSVLAIDVGNDSALKVGAGSGTITNNGTVRIVAGAKPEAYGAYSPISAGKWTTGAYGVYQAIGGKWNTDLHEFTVSGVREADSGETIGNLDLNTTQRVRIDYDTTALHWTLGASFLAQNATLGLTATATTDLSALEGMLAEGETVFGAWNLLFTSGYAEGDPAYLSFDVGAKHSRDDFKVWRYTGGAWTAFDAGDLSYDGHYANFTVTGFSGYALTGTMVPEPGTLGMALAMGAALAGYCWWRRKVYNL